MSTGWNSPRCMMSLYFIINLLGNEYWLERPEEHRHVGIEL